MPEQLIQIDARKPLARLLTILILVLVLVWTYFVVRWYLGNSIADYLSQSESTVDMAELAVRLGPNDPLTHWRLGELTDKELPPDQITRVVSEYEKAASLSPKDYRFWMAYGRALEQAGEIERGEKGLRRAVELAPHYSFPRWYLGNLLLRSGRYDEGFVELRKASEADPELRAQLFNLAWEVFKDDVQALKSSVGQSDEARAQFALYLIGRGKASDGVALWKSLSDSEKKTNSTAGVEITSSLISAHLYREAAEVWNEIAPGPNYRAVVGQIIDGSFDSGVVHGAALFSWQVQSQPQAAIGIDPQVAHNGSRSLRLTFQVRSKLDSINASQLVLVEPNTQYDFECYFRTSNLESAGTPYLSISDAADGTSLANSAQAPTGNNTWQQITLNFTTGANTKAIYLKINRANCGEEPVCPIFGSIWYDDFNLKPRR